MPTAAAVYGKNSLWLVANWFLIGFAGSNKIIVERVSIAFMINVRKCKDWYVLERKELISPENMIYYLWAP